VNTIFVIDAGGTTDTPASMASASHHAAASGGGAASRRKWARTVSVGQAKALRPPRRQVSMTVSSRSTNRLPDADCVPNDSFRQMTACRSARSAALLVGSAPATSTKVHRCSR
jgi:hypothetical protein